MRIVALSARRVDSFGREHDSGRRTWATGCPGLVIDVGVALAVAFVASDTGAGMHGGDVFLHVFEMAHEAAAVVRARGIPGGRVLAVIQEQERLIVARDRRPTILAA